MREIELLKNVIIKGFGFKKLVDLFNKDHHPYIDTLDKIFFKNLNKKRRYLQVKEINRDSHSQSSKCEWESRSISISNIGSLSYCYLGIH